MTTNLRMSLLLSAAVLISCKTTGGNARTKEAATASDSYCGCENAFSGSANPWALYLYNVDGSKEQQGSPLSSEISCAELMGQSIACRRNSRFTDYCLCENTVPNSGNPWTVNIYRLIGGTVKKDQLTAGINGQIACNQKLIALPMCQILNTGRNHCACEVRYPGSANPNAVIWHRMINNQMREDVVSDGQNGVVACNEKMATFEACRQVPNAETYCKCEMTSPGAGNPWGVIWYRTIDGRQRRDLLSGTISDLADCERMISQLTACN